MKCIYCDEDICIKDTSVYISDIHCSPNCSLLDLYYKKLRKIILDILENLPDDKVYLLQDFIDTYSISDYYEMSKFIERINGE